jgi:iterative type I PKS product template protein
MAADSLPVIDAWIEIGPNAIILPLLRKYPTIQKDALFLASMRRREHPLASLYDALAQLYVSPLELKWRNVFSHLPSVSHTSLPTYPWSKASFWVDFQEEIPPRYAAIPLPRPNAENSPPYAVLHAWIQFPHSGNGFSSLFETPMAHLSKLICGHRVREQYLCPASTYQELALAGVAVSVIFRGSSLNNRFIILHDIDFQNPLVYDEGTCNAIQTSIIFKTKNSGSWKVLTNNDGGKTHARGSFRLQLPSSTISKFNIIYPVVSHRVASITSGKDCRMFTTSSIYQVYFPRIVTYGTHYRAIRTLTICVDGTEAYATIQLPNESDHECFVVHPILMDAMLHVAGFIANIHGSTNDAFICSKVGCVEVIPSLIDDNAPYGVYVNCTWLPDGDMLAESYILEQRSANRIVAHLEGIRFRRVPLTTLEYGLTLASKTAVPDPLELEGNMKSSGSSLPLLSSQRIVEAKSGVMLSGSEALLGSVSVSYPDVFETPLDSLQAADSDPLFLSRHGIKGARTGNTLEMSRDPGISLSNTAQVKQFSDSGDRTYRSDVKALLAAILGLEVEELREDADLESLGLDSLASIEAHHALRSHFSISLPSDIFLTHTSTKAIQSFITSQLRASCESLKWSAHSCFSNTACATADDLEPADCNDAIPISVQRARVPGRVPLFLIHDGSGLVKYINNLPSIGRDLWGIHNPYFVNSQPWESIASMATEYAKYMKNVVGLGPILIGGWDLVSSEMPCQLNQYFRLVLRWDHSIRSCAPFVEIGRRGKGCRTCRLA